MFRSLFSEGPSLRSAHQSLSTHAAARFRPAVEMLEERTVAAVGVSLTASATTVLVGQPVRLMASAGGGLLANGTVTFLNGSIPLAEQTDVSEGNIERTFFLNPGTHVLTATWVGTTTILRLPGGFETINFNVQSNAVVVSILTGLENRTRTEPSPGADVTSAASPVLGKARFNEARQRLRRPVTLTNTSGLTLQGPLFLVLTGLPRGVQVKGPDGVLRKASRGRVVLDLQLKQLAAGEALVFTLDFRKVGNANLRFTAKLFVGPV